MEKEETIILSKSWSGRLMTKHKKNFVLFFEKLKKQFAYNDEIRSIIIKYGKTKSLTPEESAKVKTIVTDTLKMVGIGSLFAIPIPGSTFIMIFLMNSAKKLGIDLIPSQFKDQENELPS